MLERREEPSGLDNQTTAAVEWPLDLFRRNRRMAVADREVTVAISYEFENPIPFFAMISTLTGGDSGSDTFQMNSSATMRYEE